MAKMKEELKEYMKENNITQRELASLLNTNETYLSKILNGKRGAGKKIIQRYNNLPGVKENEDLVERVEKLEKELQKLKKQTT